VFKLFCMARQNNGLLTADADLLTPVGKRRSKSSGKSGNKKKPAARTASTRPRDSKGHFLPIPSPMTPAVCDQVLELLSDGNSLISVCNQPGMPAVHIVLRYRHIDEAFGRAYLAAKLVGAEAVHEKSLQCAEEATDYKSAQVAKVRAEIYSKHAARIAPKAFHDGVLVRASGSPDPATVNGEIESPRARILDKLAQMRRNLAMPLPAESGPVIDAEEPTETTQESESAPDGVSFPSSAVVPPIGAADEEFNLRTTGSTGGRASAPGSVSADAGVGDTPPLGAEKTGKGVSCRLSPVPSSVADGGTTAKEPRAPWWK